MVLSVRLGVGRRRITLRVYGRVYGRACPMPGAAGRWARSDHTAAPRATPRVWPCLPGAVALVGVLAACQPGAEPQSVAEMGGLLVGSLLTLVFVQTLYVTWEVLRRADLRAQSAAA